MNFDQQVTKNTIKAQAESDTLMVDFLSKCHQRLKDWDKVLMDNHPITNYERKNKHIWIGLVNTRFNQPVLKNQFVQILN